MISSDLTRENDLDKAARELRVAGADDEKLAAWARAYGDDALTVIRELKEEAESWKLACQDGD